MIVFWVLVSGKKSQNHHYFLILLACFEVVRTQGQAFLLQCCTAKATLPASLAFWPKTLVRPWPDIHLGWIASAWEAAVAQQRHTYLETCHLVKPYSHTHTHRDTHIVNESTLQVVRQMYIFTPCLRKHGNTWYSNCWVAQCFNNSTLSSCSSFF